MIVDQVDDTRTTLKYYIDELMKTNNPKEIAVAVVHNKLKEKKAELSSDILYFSGEDVADCWNCYPWDAAAYNNSIEIHESIARQCAGGDNDEDDFVSENSNSKLRKKIRSTGVPLYYVLAIMALGLFLIFNLYSRNIRLQKVITRRQQESIIRGADKRSKMTASKHAPPGRVGKHHAGGPRHR